jgi:hypothetical protein
MGKSTLFTGQPVFSQLLKLIPSRVVDKAVQVHKSDRYYKQFYTYDHLVSMLYCCFHQCTSLRETTTGLLAHGDRLRHLGLKNTPRRSTLAQANRDRTSAVFEDIFHGLARYYRTFSPDSRLNKELERFFIIDSTTFTLFNTVMRGVGLPNLSGKRKGGAKAHVVLNAVSDYPEVVCITEAKMSDRSFLKLVNLPDNSVVIMDKGYNLYSKYHQWTTQGTRYYTRLNKAAIYKVDKRRTLSKQQKEMGITKDQTIMLGNPQTKYKNPLQRARIVGYRDPHTNKELVFLTNDLECEPNQVAAMYKQRWQIETFFKKLKQNFPLKYFLGDSENAIRIQIWCSLIADLLIKIVLQKANTTNKKWSFSNLSGMLRHHLGTYINLWDFIQNPEKALLNYCPPEVQQYQLKLL